MVINRSPEDTCLLCGKDASNFKGSHMVPAGLIKTMIGKRGYEEGYVIQPDSNTPVRGFFGSANLNNTDPTIYPNEFIVDYVFCTACEKRFAVVESEIIQYLSQKFYDPNQSSNFPVIDKGDYKIIQGLRIPPKRLSIFLFGVAWRMSIQYWAQTGHQLFLRPVHHELIRKELDKVMDVDLASFHAKSDRFPNWPYLFVSCREWKSQTKNVATPNPKYIDPYCFWMDEFIFIFSFAIENILRFRKPAEFGIDINDGSAINQNGTAPYFIDVSSQIWNTANESILNESMADFKMKRFLPLSERKKITPEQANSMIHDLADKIYAETGKGYAICYDEAFKELIKK